MLSRSVAGQVVLVTGAASGMGRATAELFRVEGALVTATDDTTMLTLADGEVSSGSKRGRMASGSRLLPEPLEARVGRSSFQTLAQTVDPLLARWNAAQSRG